MRKKKLCLLLAAALIAASVPTGLKSVKPVEAGTKIAAFPGAEGGGKYATGGRGGEVYYVTNLNDSGAGSFRDAVSQSNRIVVFKVGGTIALKKDVVVQSNITVAGQTAPGGGGITIKNYKIGFGGTNSILRFVSSRPGERGTSADYDAFGGANGSGCIVDHCSIGWANDEQWGLYSNNVNATTQWTIIGPSNSFSYHSKGVHGFGVMFGKSNHSMHHNLVVHNVSRNFRGKVEGTGTADFVNNVIYNWGYQTAYGTIGHMNYVGNYLKMGNSTKGGHHYMDVDSTTNPENFGLYLSGNKMVNKDGSNYSTLCSNNWTGITYGSSNGRNEGNLKSTTAYQMLVNGEDVSVVKTAESADAAYKHVMAYVGAGIDASSRPAIDQQVVKECETGTGTLTGARPYSEANSTQKATIDKYNIACGVTYSYPSAITNGAPKDSDGDGMPDYWEKERGLNPNSKTAADGSKEANGDYCGKGYTNIEYYINDLTVNAFPAGTVTVSPKTAVAASPSPSTSPSPTPTAYTYDGTLVRSLKVNDTENGADWKIAANLTAGNLVYGDRTVTFASIPDTLKGAEYIQTACDSKSYTGDLGSFTAGDAVTVYVGVDSRMTTIPSWVSGYTKTALTMTNSNDVTYILYSKNFTKGQTVTLGTNGTSSGVVNYIALASKTQASVTTQTPAATQAPAVTQTPAVTKTPAPTSSSTVSTGDSALSLEASGSGWTGGYNASLTLKNTSSNGITNWKLYLDASQVDVTSLWCGQYTKYGSDIIITPETYNAQLSTGASTTLGFGGNGDMPSTLNYKISYEINGNWTTFQGTAAMQ